MLQKKNKINNYTINKIKLYSQHLKIRYGKDYLLLNIIMMNFLNDNKNSLKSKRMKKILFNIEIKKNNL